MQTVYWVWAFQEFGFVLVVEPVAGNRKEEQLYFGILLIVNGMWQAVVNEEAPEFIRTFSTQADAELHCLDTNLRNFRVAPLYIVERLADQETVSW